MGKAKMKGAAFASEAIVEHQGRGSRILRAKRCRVVAIMGDNKHGRCRVACQKAAHAVADQLLLVMRGNDGGKARAFQLLLQRRNWRRYKGGERQDQELHEKRHGRKGRKQAEDKRDVMNGGVHSARF
jgi:hypothetical protein